MTGRRQHANNGMAAGGRPIRVPRSVTSVRANLKRHLVEEAKRTHDLADARGCSKHNVYDLFYRDPPISPNHIELATRMLGLDEIRHERTAPARCEHRRKLSVQFLRIATTRRYRRDLLDRLLHLSARFSSAVKGILMNDLGVRHKHTMNVPPGPDSFCGGFWGPIFPSRVACEREPDDFERAKGPGKPCCDDRTAFVEIREHGVHLGEPEDFDAFGHLLSDWQFCAVFVEGGTALVLQRFEEITRPYFKGVQFRTQIAQNYSLFAKRALCFCFLFPLIVINQIVMRRSGLAVGLPCEIRDSRSADERNERRKHTYDDTPCAPPDNAAINAELTASTESLPPHHSHCPL